MDEKLKQGILETVAILNNRIEEMTDDSWISDYDYEFDIEYRNEVDRQLQGINESVAPIKAARDYLANLF